MHFGTPEASRKLAVGGAWRNHRNPHRPDDSALEGRRRISGEGSSAPAGASDLWRADPVVLARAARFTTG
jgi:hypothetical protein